jgi:hypothetical protein
MFCGLRGTPTTASQKQTMRQTEILMFFGDRATNANGFAV